MSKLAGTYTEFLEIHASEDGAALLLKSLKWPSLPEGFEGFDAKSILCQSIDGRKRMRTKAPSWYSTPCLLYPTRLCTEQCSSEAAAKIKEELVSRILKGRKDCRIADLTSGLGLDISTFSGIASRVLYNDMDPVLVAAARHNFRCLGISNAGFENRMIEPGMLDGMLCGEWQSPDVIFIDPARRDDSGKKVFLLEDCQPDVLALLPEIHTHSRHLVMKLSPMADITMAVSRLEKAGAKVREVHVIAIKGECKELLIWTDREFDGKASIHIHEDGSSFCEPIDAESCSTPVFADDMNALADKLQNGLILFEGSKAITKAGLFNLICSRFRICKAAVSTHLYFADSSSVDTLPQFGKTFKIIEMSEMSGKTLKDIARRYPMAEVSSRNLPMSSDALRKKLGVKASADIHIFAFKVQFNRDKARDVVTVCQRVV